jgi:aspartyl aminopeptidase
MRTVLRINVSKPIEPISKLAVHLGRQGKKVPKVL